MEQIVTKIEELSGKRRLVYINGEQAFALYSTEVRRYGIAEGKALAQEDLEQLRTELLDKRAVKRAMYLLQAKDYTEKELTEKLQRDFYPQESVEGALAYVRHFGYLSDERFAQMYVQFKGQKKSRKQIELFLQKKGISRELIDQACEEYYGQNEDSELEQILVQMRRKAAGKLPLSYEEKMKLMGSFYRKGFQSDSIKKALDIVVSECEHD
ncbi:MAG: regulatory protein RecX [Lachnospira sp.]|jgi:regulatory protein